MIKSLLIFVGGLVIGAFGYEALMKNVHQQQIVGMITESELNRVEAFLRTKNESDEVRYCILYRTARFYVGEISQKIEAALDGTAHNGLILNNMDSVKKTLEDFAVMEREGLEYDCENT